MANPLHEDGIGGKGLSVVSFAEKHGLSIRYVRDLCRNGKIFGARLHTQTRQWWIYPPAKLLCEPRKMRGSTSTPMHSTSLDAKQA